MGTTPSKIPGSAVSLCSLCALGFVAWKGDHGDCEMKRGDKLFVVTRRDLSPGYQAVQSIHAAQQFAMNFPLTYQEWLDRSGYIALLSVEDERELKELAMEAAGKKLAVCGFFEPDIVWGMTAIVIEPGQKSARLLQKLPLALSEF